MTELVQELEKIQNGLVPDAVTELMDRSGGFNVPSDYFREPPAAGAVSPTSRKLGRNYWPVYAGVAGVLAAVGIVVAIFAQSSSGRATQTQHNNSASTLAPAISTPESAPSVAGPHEETKSARQVVIAVQPIDAHAFAGDRDLGTSPVLVDVGETASAQIEVRKPGYVTKTLTLDGSEGRLTVVLEKKLTRVNANRPALDSRAGKRTKGSRIGNLSGGEISDPWAR